MKPGSSFFGVLKKTSLMKTVMWVAPGDSCHGTCKLNPDSVTFAQPWTGGWTCI